MKFPFQNLKIWNKKSAVTDTIGERQKTLRFDFLRFPPFGEDRTERMTDAMNQKTLWIILGSVSGAAALGAGAYALWNCKQAKMFRATRRASKILYKAGAVLQTVAGIAE